MPYAYCHTTGSGPDTDWDILRKDYDVVGSDNSVIFIDHLTGTYPTDQFYGAGCYYHKYKTDI